MIHAVMASVSTRHKQREETIKSLAPQVTSVSWYRGDVEGDKMKFNDVDRVEGYYFSCDDDLIYPPDYVQKMIAKLQEYGNRVIVTAMGRIIHHTPMIKYYRSEYITKYSCLGEVTEDTWVHIPGSGVMVFHTDYFKPEYFGNGFMADIWVAMEAQRKQVPILCMAHPALWIQQQQTDDGIYEKYRDNDSEQVNAVNSVDWKLYVR